MHKSLKFLRPKAGDREQSGINMVDLMMWLVIAALLLAAAIQGIGYYQQNANIYQMKEAVGVAKSRIMAIAANDGSIDAGDIDAIVAEENSSTSGDQITLSVGTVATTAAGDNSTGFELASASTGITTGSDDARYIRATHSGVPKYEVIYLFKDVASKKEGMHLVNSGTTDSATPAGGTPSASASPSPSASASPSPSATPSPTFTQPVNTFSTLTITAQNGSPTANHGDSHYYDIASSADNSVILAGSNGGYLYKSTDNGVTWNPVTSLGIGIWQGIAISADGTRIVIAQWNGVVRQSVDSGATWNVLSMPVANVAWRDVEMSPDGKHIVTGVDGGRMYYSHDFGATWATVPQTNSWWKSFAISDDGQTIIGASPYQTQLYITKDGGATWGWTAPAIGGNAYWGVSVSGDGKTILGGLGGSSGMHVSTDAGATWKFSSGVNSDTFRGTAMSSDGKRMIAVGNNGSNANAVYTSVDSGATWKQQTVGGTGQWYAVTMSSDGSKVAFTSNLGSKKIHTGTWQ